MFESRWVSAWCRIHVAINRRAWRFGSPTTPGMPLRGRILWALNDFAFRRWYDR